jgi:hypothetical protein
MVRLFCFYWPLTGKIRTTPDARYVLYQVELGAGLMIIGSANSSGFNSLAKHGSHCFQFWSAIVCGTVTKFS